MDLSAVTSEYKVEKRNVNNKSLCDKISKDIEELIINGGIIWGSDVHRDSFVDTVTDYLSAIEETGIFDQSNAICDMRNNTNEQMDNGIYIFDVTFRQRHCLNTTMLRYTIKDLLISSLKELLDFEIAP